MADELQLPRLAVGPFASSNPHDSRSFKRVRLHSTSPPVSSDPPLFSSDDDPSIDNYHGPRRHQKRRFRGPWFSQEPHELTTHKDQKKKRTLQRQYDSAIWMGSDGTDADDDADFSKTIQIPGNSTGTLPLAMRPSPVRKAMVPRTSPSPEELAQEHIDSCLEHGKEDIDLSSRGLRQLSNKMFKPLGSFACIPNIGEGTPFQNLRPSLKIFLASNMLKRIPGEVFNLPNLNVLSLRSNELVELPSCIGKARRLIELNIANNLLRFLPYEILDLFCGNSRLQILHLHPNPFYVPAHLRQEGPFSPIFSTSEDDQSPCSESPAQRVVSAERERTWHPQWNIAYKCRTHVRFIDIDGTLVKGPSLPGDESLFISSTAKSPFSQSTLRSFFGGSKIQAAPHDDVPEAPAPSISLRSKTLSKAPSLFELSVRTWSQSSNIPSLQEWLGFDPPETPARLLDDARTLREVEAGDRRCTICKRVFVIPRTEWIEWWFIAKVQENAGSANPSRPAVNLRDEAESMIPLLRRGCSWKCLPEKASLEDFNGTEADHKVNLRWYTVQ